MILQVHHHYIDQYDLTASAMQKCSYHRCHVLLKFKFSLSRRSCTSLKSRLRSNHFSREAQLTQSTFESSSSLGFSACSPASIGDVGEYGVTAGPDQEAWWWTYCTVCGWHEILSNPQSQKTPACVDHSFIQELQWSSMRSRCSRWSSWCIETETKEVQDLLMPKTKNHLRRSCISFITWYIKPYMKQNHYLNDSSFHRFEKLSQHRDFSFVFLLLQLRWPPCQPCKWVGLLHLSLPPTVVDLHPVLENIYTNTQIPNFNIPNSRQNFSNPEFQSNIKH